MRLLILCDDPGLRAALTAQFHDHEPPIEWLEPARVPAFAGMTADEPALIVDCLGTEDNPCAPWLAEDGFAQLIAACNAREWVWLLLSDSRVFPVSSKRRFAETDAPAPGGAAGHQLLMREQYIGDVIARHLVLRTGPLIAAQGENLLTRLLRQLRSGGAVTVPESQRFCPTPTADVARVIGAIHDQLECGAVCWGTYHYESADPANGYEFAEVVLAAAAQYWPVAGEQVQLRGGNTDGDAQIFPLLNCQHIRDTFGIQQLPWRKAVPALLKQIYVDNPL